jgi:DnaJ-domain-containing protein 1
MSPEKIEKLFYIGQVAIGALLVGAFLVLRPKEPESGFKVREADRKDEPWKKGGPSDNKLADAKMKRVAPLSLPGIRIDGEPHEILGVAADASADSINRAYRELMKRYHPDAVGRQGSQEWTDAQKIAEAINRAKDQLLRSRGRR